MFAECEGWWNVLSPVGGITGFRSVRPAITETRTHSGGSPAGGPAGERTGPERIGGPDGAQYGSVRRPEGVRRSSGSAAARAAREVWRGVRTYTRRETGLVVVMAVTFPIDPARTVICLEACQPPLIKSSY